METLSTVHMLHYCCGFHIVRCMGSSQIGFYFAKKNALIITLKPIVIPLVKPVGDLIGLRYNIVRLFRVVLLKMHSLQL